MFDPGVGWRLCLFAVALTYIKWESTRCPPPLRPSDLYSSVRLHIKSISLNSFQPSKTTKEQTATSSASWRHSGQKSFCHSGHLMIALTSFSFVPWSPPGGSTAPPTHTHTHTHTELHGKWQHTNIFGSFTHYNSEKTDRPGFKKSYTSFIWKTEHLFQSYVINHAIVRRNCLHFVSIDTGILIFTFSWFSYYSVSVLLSLCFPPA